MSAYNSDFQRVLEDRLEERYNSLVTALAENNASDFADYRFRCGQLEEIRQLGAIIKETARSIYTPSETEKT